jgi:hypothetical protein
MIRESRLEDGRIEIEEHIGRPSVYLDHWALNVIALDATSKERFVRILNTRQGTLRLSVSNIAELSKQSDQQQISSILDMIDAVNVNVGFIETDFRQVIDRENALLEGGSAQNPSQQIDLICAYLLAKNWPDSWMISDVIRIALENTHAKSMVESWENFAAEMEDFLGAIRSDASQMNTQKGKARATRKRGKRYDCPTRELVQLGFNFVLQDTRMRMNTNEWHDFFHCIVPASYCDFVLVDKRWKTFICQTRLGFPDVAMVFDNKSIETFFDELERKDLNG